MNIREQNQPVTMIRPDLENLPVFDVPEGFCLRWFQTGDEQVWTDLHSASEQLRSITPGLFVQQFGTDEKILHQRQCYLIAPSGLTVGTATAWFDDDSLDPRRGRVHWVAVVPEWQGRGLGNVLTSVVCRRLRDLGHDKAFLRTSTARIRAIRLYESFGFVPLIRNEEERRVWAELEPMLQ